MTLRERFKRSSVTNQANVIFAGLICLMTLVNIFFFVKQVLDQDRQVEQIRNAITDGIGTAKQSIDVTLPQNNATVKAILDENGTALDASRAGAEKALSATISSSRNDLQAWVGPKSETGRLQVSVGKPVIQQEGA